MKKLTKKTADGSPESMENTCRKELLRLAKKFAKRHNLSLATVSREAHGADHFLKRFASGEVTVTLSKYDEMVSFLAAGKRKERASI